jgi:adenosylhomocysteine nucleosidase
MICYAFPLAHEAAECTERESFAIGRLHCTLGNLGGRHVLIARVGMGQERAAEHTRMVFQYFRPKALVLAGYGGALVPQLKLGQIVISRNYSSDVLLPFLRLVAGFDFAEFYTADEIAGTLAERTRCANTSRAQVIEMETAAVAAVVAERGIPFLAVRVISDELRTDLPTEALAAGFDPEAGRPTPVRLATHLATHPRQFKPFKEFVRNLGTARKSLTSFMSLLNRELPAGW